ncbi:MAG: Bacteriophage-related protein [Candidatus Gottesmanbacteria bacterium GW2011_GWB1_49_7]|uniref:Bacteriophage-related protein n=1 Tax=Candidatus Gottesmanbacteria bacterium GW2011_GWB1_49_7 TaxID=1618448 RepID=A0A0G1W3Z2_9BACT|nr:MAG: Bacteriophage-related protein [Candidatus Gottesmanbacteria bacterium GW2011_GWB1_49_7]
MGEETKESKIRLSIIAGETADVKKITALLGTIRKEALETQKALQLAITGGGKGPGGAPGGGPSRAANIQGEINKRARATQKAATQELNTFKSTLERRYKVNKQAYDAEAATQKKGMDLRRKYQREEQRDTKAANAVRRAEVQKQYKYEQDLINKGVKAQAKIQEARMKSGLSPQWVAQGVGSQVVQRRMATTPKMSDLSRNEQKRIRQAVKYQSRLKKRRATSGLSPLSVVAASGLSGQARQLSETRKGTGGKSAVALTTAVQAATAKARATAAANELQVFRSQQATTTKAKAERYSQLARTAGGFDRTKVKLPGPGMGGLRMAPKPSPRFAKGSGFTSAPEFIAIGAAGLAFKQVIGAAMSFEKSMATVGAVTGATSSEFEKLREAALRTASGTVFTTAQVGDAMVTLGRAGFSTAETISAIEPVMKLATVAGEDFSVTSGFVTGMLRQFNISAADTIRVTDGLAKASNSSQATIKDMGQALSYVGPIASKLGSSFEETTGVLAALADQNIKSSAAGTALRRIFIELIDPKNFAVMKQLGIPLADLDIKTHGLVGVLRRLQEATITNTEALDVFGTRGLTPFLALMADGRQSLESYVDAQMKATGTTNEMESAITDNLIDSLLKLKSAALNPIIDRFRVLDDVGSSVANTLRGGFESKGILGNVLGDVTTVGATLLGVFGVGGMVVVGIKGIARIVSFLGPSFAAANLQVMKLNTGVITSNLSMRSLGASAASVKTAFMGMGAINIGAIFGMAAIEAASIALDKYNEHLDRFIEKVSIPGGILGKERVAKLLEPLGAPDAPVSEAQLSSINLSLGKAEDAALVKLNKEKAKEVELTKELAKAREHAAKTSIFNPMDKAIRTAAAIALGEQQAVQATAVADANLQLLAIEGATEQARARKVKTDVAEATSRAQANKSFQQKTLELEMKGLDRRAALTRDSRAKLAIQAMKLERRLQEDTKSLDETYEQLAADRGVDMTAELTAAKMDLQEQYHADLLELEKRTAGTSAHIWESAMASMERGVADGFTAMALDGKKASEALKDIQKSIIRSTVQSVGMGLGQSASAGLSGAAGPGRATLGSMFSDAKGFFSSSPAKTNAEPMKVEVSTKRNHPIETDLTRVGGDPVKTGKPAPAAGQGFGSRAMSAVGGLDLGQLLGAGVGGMILLKGLSDISKGKHGGMTQAVVGGGQIGGSIAGPIGGVVGLVVGGIAGGIAKQTRKVGKTGMLLGLAGPAGGALSHYGVGGSATLTKKRHRRAKQAGAMMAMVEAQRQGERERAATQLQEMFGGGLATTEGAAVLGQMLSGGINEQELQALEAGAGDVVGALGGSVGAVQAPSTTVTMNPTFIIRTGMDMQKAAQTLGQMIAQASPYGSIGSP